MRYIDSWLTGLGLEYIIPKLKANGITTPKKLALLTLRDMYEVVGVEDAEDRKKLYFLIQRLHTILNNKPEIAGSPGGDNDDDFAADNHNSAPHSPSVNQRASSYGDDVVKSTGSDRNNEEDLRVLRRHRRSSTDGNVPPAPVALSPKSARQNNISAISASNQDSVPYEIRSGRNLKAAAGAKNTSSAVVDDVSSNFKDVSVKDKQQSIAYAEASKTAGNRVKKAFAPPLEPPPPSPPREEVPVLSARNMRQEHSNKAQLSVPVAASSRHRPSHSVDNQYRSLSPPASPPSAPPPISNHLRGGQADSHRQQVAKSRAPPPPAAVVAAVEDEDEDPNSSCIEDMAIRVVVRKRPLSRFELNKGDRDVMDITSGGCVKVHEPKTKVDLTKVIETQSFTFDDAFDADETNEVIYSRTIQSLVSFVFDGGKASCFAYGQTGSGKTFSMMGSRPDAPAEATENAGLYVLAARDIFSYVKRPKFQHVKVLVSCFEIYGGKLYDLLNERGIVKCLEDSKQQVQLPGLTEHLVRNVGELLELMAKAHTQRSTGSTGANAESSRSHQVMQIVLRDGGAKAPAPPKYGLSSRPAVVAQPLPSNRFPGGKLSFIDLAGSERGADTTGNSKQTRMEGAEINTSLLALKEVIRSLERKHGHTPFRGSKLTQVLKDSFVGEKTRTCMVACVSPSHSNCEHTLNTLRYADRVKEHQSGSGAGGGAHVGSSQYDSMAYDYVPPSGKAPSQQQQDLPPRPHTAGSVAPSAIGKAVTSSSSAANLKQQSQQQRGVSPSVGIVPVSKLQQPSSSRNRQQQVTTPDMSEDIPATRPMSGRSAPAPPSKSTAVNVPKGNVRQQTPYESDTMSNGSDAQQQASNKRRQSVAPPVTAVSKLKVHSKSTAAAHQDTDNSSNNGYPEQQERHHKQHHSSSNNDRNKTQQHPPQHNRHNASGSGRSNRVHSDEDGEDRFLHQNLAAGYAPPDDEDDEDEEEVPVKVKGMAPHRHTSDNSNRRTSSNNNSRIQQMTEEEDEEDEDEYDLLQQHGRDGLDSTEQLITKTVGLLSAHKLSIAEMVEVMKEEMELVQEMENVDDRDAELYINKLDRILQAKSDAIGELRAELGRFQQYRSRSSKSGRY